MRNSLEESMHESPWNVLHVTANHEKRVAQHLNCRAVEHYLPLYTERSHWTDRTVELERPLFAGYVFIRFSAPQKLSIISIPGVLQVLGGNGCQTVSSQELDRIRLALSGGQRLRPHPFLAVGVQVRVRGGIFDGAQGVVAEMRRECKVVIALSGVQQSFSLEIGMDQLELVNIPPRQVAPSHSMHLIN
jgi:transcription antitermination factor NusG